MATQPLGEAIEAIDAALAKAEKPVARQFGSTVSLKELESSKD